MPVPSAITDLSQTAASNYPSGSDSPTVLDDVQRAQASFIAILRDGKGHSAPVTLASASTTDIGAQNSLFVEITGTTTITSFGSTYNGPRFLRFTGALTLTHGANLYLPGAANIVTVAGDTAIAVPNSGSTGWNVYDYKRISAPADNFAAVEYTTTGSAGAYVLTPTVPLAALTTGTRYRVVLSFSTTGACTLAVSGLTATAIKQYTSAGAKTDPTLVSGQITDIEYDGTHWVVLDPLPAQTTVPRSYLSGCTLSTAGSSATMSIADGQCVDSTNAVVMSLSALAKTTSSWAVGTATGGLDTGAIANSTWYYFYVIRRPDTGVVDVVFSTSSSAPTLPTNYTQYRYIGAGLTNGSAQWVKFTQFGDEFTWDTPVLDYNTTGSTTAANLTLSIPRGRKMKAWMNVYLNQDTNQVYFSDPSNSDLAPSLTAAPLGSLGYTSASFAGTVQATCWTNTSAQVRHREANGTGTLRVATLGWTDLRGKDL